MSAMCGFARQPHLKTTSGPWEHVEGSPARCTILLTRASPMPRRRPGRPARPRRCPGGCRDGQQFRLVNLRRFWPGLRATSICTSPSAATVLLTNSRAASSGGAILAGSLRRATWTRRIVPRRSSWPGQLPPAPTSRRRCAAGWRIRAPGRALPPSGREWSAFPGQSLDPGAVPQGDDGTDAAPSGRDEHAVDHQ